MPFKQFAYNFFLFIVIFFPVPQAAGGGGGKTYVFFGGREGALAKCPNLSKHHLGDSGGSDIAGAVKRSQNGETITVAAHSDGSIAASKFIRAVKAKNPDAKIRYINFEGYRPTHGFSKISGLSGVESTCVTMKGARNYPHLTRRDAGCTHLSVVPSKNLSGNPWVRHYAVMSCSFLN
jgi:hypothetical protein